MPDDKYVDLGLHLPRIAWAWNTHESASNGFSPYELIYGKEPPTLSSALARIYESRSPSGGEIRESAEAYRKLAAAHQAYMRKETPQGGSTCAGLQARVQDRRLAG